jgi:phosphoribosylformylglycinamidine synthase
MKTKAAVLRTAGVNCDRETLHALRICGADAELVHINELLSKEKSIMDYKILAVAGGFSYGDDVAAGKILANEIKYKLIDAVKKFAAAKRLVIGICNGFQVLVKTGLLPGFEGVDKEEYTTLTFNDSGKFEDRWVYLKKQDSKCIFTANLKKIVYLPIAHGEGKFITLNKQVLNKLKANKQIVFKYTDKNGDEGDYPDNPNGSVEAIAGICNPEGNIFGLMPHPERFLTKYTHPRWTRGGLPEDGDGIQIFKNAVDFADKYL